jgi:acetyltransferase-like isoleucine patch superfamily enzyme
MQRPKLDILLYHCNRRWMRFEMEESIATRAMILPGVSIAERAVVAAGSVLTREVPTYTIVAGGLPHLLTREINNTINHRLLFF